MVWTTLWWEHRALRLIATKNLVAHRVRNRKTTIMYTLSLAFIVFITVTFSVQTETAKFQTEQR